MQLDTFVLQSLSPKSRSKSLFISCWGFRTDILQITISSRRTDGSANINILEIHQLLQKFFGHYLIPVVCNKHIPFPKLQQDLKWLGWSASPIFRFRLMVIKIFERVEIEAFQKEIDLVGKRATSMENKKIGFHWLNIHWVKKRHHGQAKHDALQVCMTSVTEMDLEYLWNVIFLIYKFVIFWELGTNCTSMSLKQLPLFSEVDSTAIYARYSKIPVSNKTHIASSLSYISVCFSVQNQGWQESWTRYTPFNHTYLKYVCNISKDGILPRKLILWSDNLPKTQNCEQEICKKETKEQNRPMYCIEKFPQSSRTGQRQVYQLGIMSKCEKLQHGYAVLIKLYKIEQI